MRAGDWFMMGFWFIVIIKWGGLFTRMLSKREYLSLQVISSGLALLGTFCFAVIDGELFMNIFLGFWTLIFYVDYKVWKKHKDDDDDDYKHKRRAWVKNKLPKPKAKTIAQPI